MQPKIVHDTWTKGDSEAFAYLIEENGVPLDVSVGWQFWITIKGNLSLADTATADVLQFSTAAGTLLIADKDGVAQNCVIIGNASPAQTKTLVAGRRYFHDFQGKSPSGEVLTFCFGYLTILPEVTLAS